MMKKIYDCFTFFNELDLLELRLKQLDSHVDHFVLCEATRTFQGKAKPLYYLQNKERYRKFSDKIIHVVVDLPDPPGHENMGEEAYWVREHFQRNALRRGLSSAAPDDVIIISDCDEIASPSALQRLRQDSGYFVLDMAMYQFFINMQAMEAGWRKVFAFSYELLPRIPDFNSSRTSELVGYRRFSDCGHYLDHAGWHFTFLGGVDGVRSKLSAYSHADKWRRNLLENQEEMEEQLLALHAVSTSSPLIYKRIDDSFPAEITNNLGHYTRLGFVKGELERLKELEQLWLRNSARYASLSEAYAAATARLQSIDQALSRESAKPGLLFNLIPASSAFGELWNAGVQTKHPRISTNVPPFREGCAVMRHSRDGSDVTADANVGYYQFIPASKGQAYTASCWLWIPKGSAEIIADLSLDNWRQREKHIARPELRGQWQRVWVQGEATDEQTYATIVLRVYSEDPADVYSTCWQFALGERPTEYWST